ncbi:MAG: hypothetical protein U1E73_02005 [Planctomycetota bacterium]
MKPNKLALSFSLVMLGSAACHNGNGGTPSEAHIADVVVDAVRVAIEELEPVKAANVLGALVPLPRDEAARVIHDARVAARVQSPEGDEIETEIAAASRYGTPLRIRSKGMSRSVDALLAARLGDPVTHAVLGQLLEADGFPGLDAISTRDGGLRWLLRDRPQLADALLDKMQAQRPVSEALDLLLAAMNQDAVEITAQVHELNNDPAARQRIAERQRSLNRLVVAGGAVLREAGPGGQLAAVLWDRTASLAVSATRLPALTAPDLVDGWFDPVEWVSDAGDAVSDAVDFVVEIGGQVVDLADVLTWLFDETAQLPEELVSLLDDLLPAREMILASSAAYTQALEGLQGMVGELQQAMNDRLDSLGNQLAQVASAIAGLRTQIDGLYAQLDHVLDVITQQIAALGQSLRVQHEFVMAAIDALRHEVRTATTAVEHLAGTVLWLNAETVLRDQQREFDDLDAMLTEAFAVPDTGESERRFEGAVARAAYMVNDPANAWQPPLATLPDALAILAPPVTDATGRTQDLAGGVGVLLAIAQIYGVSLPLTGRPTNYATVPVVVGKVLDRLTRRPDVFADPTARAAAMEPLTSMIARERQLLLTSLRILLAYALDDLEQRAPAVTAEFRQVVDDAAATFLPAHLPGPIPRLLDDYLATVDVDSATHRYRITTRDLGQPVFVSAGGSATGYSTQAGGSYELAVGSDYWRLGLQAGCLSSTLVSSTANSETWLLAWTLDPTVANGSATLSAANGTPAVRVTLSRASAGAPIMVQLETAANLVQASEAVGSVFREYLERVRARVLEQIAAAGTCEQMAAYAGGLAVLRHLLGILAELGYADRELSGRVALALQHPLLAANAVQSARAAQEPGTIRQQIRLGLADHLSALAVEDTGPQRFDEIVGNLLGGTQDLTGLVHAAVDPYLSTGFGTPWFDDPAAWVAGYAAGG